MLNVFYAYRIFESTLNNYNHTYGVLILYATYLSYKFYVLVLGKLIHVSYFEGLCDELITHPEESYRLWCVVVCDLETS